MSQEAQTSSLNFSIADVCHNSKNEDRNSLVNGPDNNTSNGVCVSGCSSDNTVSDVAKANGAVPRLEQSPSVEEAKEAAIGRLQDLLVEAHEELRQQEDQCRRLASMQEHVDKEIQELTSSLFKEAYRMVNDATAKQMHAEKLLQESNGKIDMLQAEVGALKDLLKTQLHSTPTKQHFSPQRTPGSHSKSTPAKDSPRRSLFAASIQSVLRAEPEVTGVPKVCEECGRSETDRKLLSFKEVDPMTHQEFAMWRSKQDLNDREHPFLKRVFAEDILPCLDFRNTQLSSDVLTAIEQNTLVVEDLNKEKPEARTCALLQVTRLCPYRMKLSVEAGDWHFLSHIARNRVTSVCDLWTYLRYLSEGLLNRGVHDAFDGVVLRRRNLALAKLGFLPPDVATD